MKASDEIHELLRNPVLKDYFGTEMPSFADLNQALSSFGNPLFEMNKEGSFCSVIVLTIEGKKLFRGVTGTQANPSAAGLACLLELLDYFPGSKFSAEAAPEPDYLDQFRQAYI
jgi:hypothetical protein